MSMQTIRIQLVDDHEIVRTGFRNLLEKEGDMKVVVESASGKQGCRDYDTCQPDILVMDVSLPDISGLEAMRRVLHRHPQARVLILSMHAGMVAAQAMQQGAKGFVCKRSEAGRLISAIRAIMYGRQYVDEKVDEDWSGEGVELSRDPHESLTKRELEICMHLTKGRTVAEISRAMYLSEKTVYTHRQHIMNKLGVVTASRLVGAVTTLGIHP